VRAMRKGQGSAEASRMDGAIAEPRKARPGTERERNWGMRPKEKR